jgi:hypothetical protein
LQQQQSLHVFGRKASRTAAWILVEPCTADAFAAPSPSDQRVPALRWVQTDQSRVLNQTRLRTHGSIDGTLTHGTQVLEKAAVAQAGKYYRKVP